MDYETVGDPLDVGHLEGGDLGAPRRRREADQQQRAVSPADQVSGMCSSMAAIARAVAGAFCTGATPTRRRMPRIHVGDVSPGRQTLGVRTAVIEGKPPTVLAPLRTPRSSLARPTLSAPSGLCIVQRQHWLCRRRLSQVGQVEHEAIERHRLGKQESLPKFDAQRADTLALILRFYAFGDNREVQRFGQFDDG
jgi:hypothetical protein